MLSISAKMARVLDGGNITIDMPNGLRFLPSFSISCFYIFLSKTDTTALEFFTLKLNRICLCLNCNGG